MSGAPVPPPPGPAARRSLTVVNDYEVPEKPHVWLRDGGACGSTCPAAPCLTLCPAGAFDVAAGPEGPRLVVFHGVCLECAGCLYFCPEGNVGFEFPPGGTDIHHRFG